MSTDTKSERLIFVSPILFAWWNTSLSPLAKSRAKPDDKSFAISVITDIFNEQGVDFLALGEVCEDDLKAIVDSLGNDYICYEYVKKKKGRLKFDTAVMYDKRRFEITDEHVYEDSYVNGKIKTGVRYDVFLKELNIIVHIFISHWPSRMFCSEDDSKIIELGSVLRNKIKKLHDDSSNPYVMLMGDYNVEPFSKSLSQHLYATRDRSLVKKNKIFLYNPFWRHLCESQHFNLSQEIPGICGTYYYHSGVHTHWHTYDQIIFSSAFLNDGLLLLNEEYSGIVRIPELEKRLRNSKEIFDHLPVMSTIQIGDKNG